MEGVSQEAIAFAGHFKLNKMIVIYDHNNITIDGPVNVTDSVDQIARFKSAGWNAFAIDGLICKDNVYEINTWCKVYSLSGSMGK